MGRSLLGASVVLSMSLAPACTTEATNVDTGPTIVVKNNVFEPRETTIQRGDTVTFRWSGGVHDVVSGSSCTHDGKFKSGEPVAGATFEQRFDTAGTFDYFCSVHCADGMVGKVIVQ